MTAGFRDHLNLDAIVAYADGEMPMVAYPAGRRARLALPAVRGRGQPAGAGPLLVAGGRHAGDADSAAGHACGRSRWCRPATSRPSGAPVDRRPAGPSAPTTRAAPGTIGTGGSGSSAPGRSSPAWPSARWRLRADAAGHRVPGASTGTWSAAVTHPVRGAGQASAALTRIAQAS